MSIAFPWPWKLLTTLAARRLGVNSRASPRGICGGYVAQKQDCVYEYFEFFKSVTILLMLHIH